MKNTGAMVANYAIFLLQLTQISKKTRRETSFLFLRRFPVVAMTDEDDKVARLNFIAAVIVRNYFTIPPVAEDAQINIKSVIMR